MTSKGDLSNFVEEAVRWRMLDRTVQAAKDRMADVTEETLEIAINEALAEIRTQSQH